MYLRKQTTSQIFQKLPAVTGCACLANFGESPESGLLTFWTGSCFFGVLFLNEPVYNAHINCNSFRRELVAMMHCQTFRILRGLSDSRGIRRLLEKSNSRVSMHLIYIILFFHIWYNSRRFHRIQIGVRIFKSRISVGDWTTKIHFTQNFFIEKCDS